ncbi:LOW QUALITY PROTEIN: DNA polymerase delta subunit 3, partial [Anomaloglossus baeobatrachus]|uniref:LOW QUALITY PROTEIN: DNA polymerase delta subunit 3 n=1 Tax=Anomaloglossus baeobatrachus TaxID=238106 RepID=UPI003F4FB094
VHVTYLLSGTCVQDGISYHKVAVVKEEKLEAAKSKLSAVATVHVYSLQKATLKDSAPLNSADYDIIKNNLHNCNKFSAIQCAAAVPRSPEEVAQLQKSHFQQERRNTVSATPSVNGYKSPPPANLHPQPTGIMGMFSRPAAKSQEVKKDTEPKPNREAGPDSSSQQPAKSSAISNFFGKASMNKVKESPAAAVISETLKEESASAPRIPAPENKEKESEPLKSAAKNKSKVKRVALPDSDEEPEALVKKRRRIKRPQSDSSDDEGAVTLSPDVKMPSPPPPPPPPAPSPAPSPPHSDPNVKMETEPQSQTHPGEKRRKRKRVLKSKMFVDGDGCMVTEKVYESESCTDSGEDFTASKPSVKPSTSSKTQTKAEPKATKKATTAATNKGTKQASIMGFFQKK